MSDLISRQEAIDAMCSACGYDCDKSEFVYDAPQDEQVILCPEHYALTVLPSAQPEQRWTPNSEKPPKEGKYLVWMPFAPPKHRVAVAEYCGGYWNIKTSISAWMPLPEPYMEVKSDNESKNEH